MQLGNAEYYHARQSCYLCLNPEDGVDTEVQIDYEGVLFLCRNCVRTMAEFLGFKVDVDRQPEIDALEEKLADSREAQLYAESIVIGLNGKAKDMQAARMARVREAKAQKKEVDA